MNRGVNSGEFIDPFNIRPMSDTAKNPNETTSEEMATAVSRIQSAMRLAKEYLAKNDELSTWFLEEFEEDTEVDAAGFIVNFVSLKDVKELYVSQPIFTSMRKEDQRKFSTKKLKEDFENNILLRKFFKPAMKVKLASSKKANTKEGLIHFKRRVEHDDDVDQPAAQRQCLQQHHGVDDQFGA